MNDLTWLAELDVGGSVIVEGRGRAYVDTVVRKNRNWIFLADWHFDRRYLTAYSTKTGEERKSLFSSTNRRLVFPAPELVFRIVDRNQREAAIHTISLAGFGRLDTPALVALAALLKGEPNDA